MPAPPVSTLPPAPSPTDSKAEFNAKAYPFVNSLSTMASQMNAVSDWINANLNNVGPSVFTDIVVDAPVGQATLHLRQAGVENGRVYAGGGPGTDVIIAASRFVQIQAFEGFKINTGNPTLAENVTVAANGNTGFGVTVPDTSARIQSSNGISLGATPNAHPKVLDWYEEGTFTPTVSGTTTAGTATYTTRTGSFTRVGNRVFFNTNIAYSGHTGTGATTITGLPYTSSAGVYSTFPCYVNGWAYTSGNILQIYVNPSSTVISMDYRTFGGSTVQAAIQPSVALLVISGSYGV
jgi:hypothetical protein